MEQRAEWFKKTWSDTPLDLNDTLVAEFKILTTSVAATYPFIRIEFFWHRNERDRYILEACPCNEKTLLSHTFTNMVKLDGWLKWVVLLEGVDNNNSGVFGNIHLSSGSGAAQRWHYEGMMTTFPWGGGPQPKPVPPHPLPPVDPVPALEVVRRSEELFPYIHMRTWPRVDNRDLKLHFVNYADGPSSPGTLYNKLIDSNNPPGTGDRAAMEQLAVDYINGDNDWKGEFVDNVFTMPGTCQYFYNLTEYARNFHDRDLNQIIADIVRDGIADGTIRKDVEPQTLAHIIWGDQSGILPSYDTQTNAYSWLGLGIVIQNREHIFICRMLFRAGNLAMPATNAFFSIYKNSFHQYLLSLF